jgi:hypothetical protein
MSSVVVYRRAGSATTTIAVRREGHIRNMGRKCNHHLKNLKSTIVIDKDISEMPIKK